MANKILSIEIGSRITRVIETDFKTKNPKIYKSFSFETPKELFEEEEVASTEEFRDRLLEGLKENKIKTKRVIFVLASSRIASRDVVIPKVKENQILTLLHANSAEYFPVDLQQYRLVYRILGEVEEEGEKKYKLMVLAVPHDMIEAYQKLASDCELILGGLDYVGNAATRILIDKVTENLYAAVKIEDDNTIVTIVKEGKIQLQRTFTYGIEEAVEVIQRSERFGENLSFGDALKILWTESFYDKKEDDERNRDLAEDLADTFRAIIGNVSRVINYYSSNNAGAQMDSIILYGMGADVKDLAEALKNELNVPISTDVLQENILRDKADTNPDFYPLSYAVCVGAVIEPMDFRLEQAEKRKKKERRSGEKTSTKKIKLNLTAEGFFKICILVSVLLLLAVIPYHIFLKAEINKMQKETAEKQYLSDLYTQCETAKKECDDIASLYASTETTSEGIGAFILELEKKMPSNISVESFTSDSEGILMDFNVKTKREAAKVIDEMSSFDSIRDVEMQNLEEVRDELGNTTVNCSIFCTYVNGTEDEEGAEETTVEEDVETKNSSNE